MSDFGDMYEAGFTIGEIAVAFGLPEGNIRRHLRRRLARTTMRELSPEQRREERARLFDRVEDDDAASG